MSDFGCIAGSRVIWKSASSDGCYVGIEEANWPGNAVAAEAAPLHGVSVSAASFCTATVMILVLQDCEQELRLTHAAWRHVFRGVAC